MTNIDLYCISGVINSCPLPNCAREKRSPDQKFPPGIINHVFSCSMEALEKTTKNSVTPSPYFWKARTIAYLGLASNIHSASFIPFDLKSDQLLFLQKHSRCPPYIGYFAPYLPEKTQKKWECLQIENATVHNLPSSLITENLHSYLSGIDPSDFSVAYLCLLAFYQDALTATISITFKKTISDTSSCEEYSTHVWVKEEEILEL